MRFESISLALSTLVLIGALTAHAGSIHGNQIQPPAQLPSSNQRGDLYAGYDYTASGLPGAPLFRTIEISTDEVVGEQYLRLSQTRYDPYKNFKFRVNWDGDSSDADVIEDLFGDG